MAVQEAGSAVELERNERKRQRLVAIVAKVQAEHYLGKTALSADQIEELSDKEIEKLYTRYEARLGASNTCSLNPEIVHIYCTEPLIPVGWEEVLEADLGADPFVRHALSSAACELYHRYGMYLAPVTAILSTVKHCQLEGKLKTQYSTHGNSSGGNDADTVRLRRS